MNPPIVRVLPWGTGAYFLEPGPAVSEVRYHNDDPIRYEEQAKRYWPFVCFGYPAPMPTVAKLDMINRKKRDQWLQDIEARQRNIVFPDTVQNEARFWGNIGKTPPTVSTKIGLAVLGTGFYSFAAVLVVAAYREGVIWAFALAFLLLWVPVFGAIAWAARRSLRKAQNAPRGPRTQRHRV